MPVVAALRFRAKIRLPHTTALHVFRRQSGLSGIGCGGRKNYMHIYDFLHAM